MYFKKNCINQGAVVALDLKYVGALAYKPKYLLADNSEVALYNIYNELKSLDHFVENNNKVTIIPFLVDILDETNLSHIFQNWKPETVYHTAYKHVPIVEHNIIAGIKNNLIGTFKCADLALKNNVKNFVLISTDKAVRPTNIMGASKRLEITVQLFNKDPHNESTLFSIVRFGNVIGSWFGHSLFRKQIKAGGPLTLTHKNVTRYFDCKRSCATCNSSGSYIKRW